MRSSKILLFILCIAAILRLVSILVLHTYSNPKTWEFGEIAHVIVSGHGYTAVLADGNRVPSAYMPPLYPYLLSSLWSTLGESKNTYFLLELGQAILGVLLVFYIYRLAALLFSSRVATCTSVLVTFWPSFIYLCNEFHSINIYILLNVVAVYYLVSYIEISRSQQNAALLGLSLGALFYCRAEAVYLLALYTAVLIWRCGKNSLFHACIICLIALVAITPWAIRNYRVFGRFVLVTTSGGINLWTGHNAHALGNSTWSPTDFPSPDQLETLKTLMGRPESEVLLDRQAKIYAIQFACSHPRQEAKLALKKMLLFLLFDPSHRKGRNPAYWGPSFLLLVLALYGAWLHRNSLITRDLPVVVTIAFAFLLSVVVFALPRYRIAIDPFLALFAANALMSWFPEKALRSDEAPLDADPKHA